MKKEESKAHNRAIVKAQDEDQYYFINQDTTNAPLKVDLAPMMTKCIFPEKIHLWVRLGTSPKSLSVTIGGASWAMGTVIPVDDNIIFYSGASTIASGSQFTANSDGHLTYKGVYN